MAVDLEGGCRVTHFKEGEPVRVGTLGVWPQVGRAVGASAISLRTLELEPGLSPGLRNPSCDEILYVLAGEATVYVDGWVYRLEPESGLYVRPGDSFAIHK